MAKYVKCIDSSGWDGDLTSDNSYKVLHNDGLNYMIRSDEGVNRWFEHTRFEESYEIPDMIVFSSQQEFEDAVMAVVMKRLGVERGRWINDFELVDNK